MLRAVNAEVQQQVLGRDRPHHPDLQLDRARAPPQPFLVGGEPERARRDPPMDVHRPQPVGSGEGVLALLKVAGRQPVAPGMRRQISFGGQYLGHPRQVSLVYQNIQIDELPKLDRSVRHRRQRRTLEADRRNLGRLQDAHQPHQLCRQMAVVENDQLPLRPQLRQTLLRNRSRTFEFQIAIDQREHRMALGDIGDQLPAPHPPRKLARRRRARGRGRICRAAQHQRRFDWQGGRVEKMVAAH